MAERVIVENYNQMISALNTAAKGILEETKTMLGLAQTCASALGEGDKGAQELVSQTATISQGLYDCASTAHDIANTMQDELDAMMQEAAVWDED